ncbi:hypothetical protein [Undibacterium parvum]|uniref:Uncharacterized protein n=1 Tax=Undibacterium parvum TaxID=401471 RepID=A0A3Q9BRC2_9BURK|nr:hypothetical protein [Undibacterium parvum]AZP12765.1 hypothetical protein EJN92_12595 [Undibacterium parvum]
MRFFEHAGLRAACNMRAGTVAVLLVSLLCDCRPVVDRQLLPFLASPRNGSKRRRRKVTALRVPNYAGRKMGNEANSLRSDSFTSDPFSAPHNWQRHMRIRFKSKVKSHVKSQFKNQFKSQFKNNIGLP